MVLASKARHMDMQHGGLAVIQRGKATVNRCCKLVRLGDAFAVGAEGLGQSRKVPPFALTT